jgi:hypothetical protein
VDEVKGSGAVGAQQVTRVDGPQFLNPDSALVRTALDLLAAHVVDGAAGESALCGHCGRYFPCPTVEHARQVVDAGGLRGAEGPAERVPEVVVDPAPDAPAERVPDVVPQRVPDTAAEEDDLVAARDPVGAA